MSKNIWIIWALILILPGAAGLGYHFAQKNEIHAQISAAVEATSENPATDEYLQMYDAWSRLEIEEQAENPWGQGEYGGPEIQKRLRENQNNQLWADIPDLDSGLIHYPKELAETLYGIGWESELEAYQKQCEVADMTLIGSILVLSSGGLILFGGLLKISVGLVLRKKAAKSQDEENDTAESDDSDESSESETEAASTVSDPDDTQPVSEEDVPLDVEISAFTESAPVSDAEKLSLKKDNSDSPVDKNDPGYFGTKKGASQEGAFEKVATAAGAKTSLASLTAALSSSDSKKKPVKDAYFGWAVDTDDSEELHSMMTNEPLSKELNDLTEEMSAIREFAAQQQDQVRKLQDGYDWMIIRRFCMRIIRCIDNIEDRRERQDDENGDVAVCLEDIRDELVFALESSGIEQFEPDVEIPFKGLEKYAEAVRGRIKTDNQELIGTIAKVVRPGYQYLISDEDIKIVRCAQVQLYEANQSE